MKIYLLVVSLLLLVGCKPDSNGQAKVDTKQEKDQERITAKDIEAIEYTEYVLSPDAKLAVQNWQRYQELMAQLEFLKQGDFSFFGGKNDLMINFLKELKNEVPATLASPAIKERLIALETKILKFHSTLKLSNLKKKEVLDDIEAILVATSNLHLQMNKKFEFESQIIEDPSAN